MADSRPLAASPPGLTLVEMLIAMAITIIMMGAVVTLFANISNSVRNRRATIEMSNQLRHVRNVLQQDLAGATCPGLTWQRPESNHGYIEIIEGPYREGNASGLLHTADPSVQRPRIDHTISIIPSSNLRFNETPGQESWVTDGAGLGDYDDILMLTVRNEHEPFVGRVPNVRDSNNNFTNFANWTFATIESPLAEVIWFAIENPGYTGTPADDEVIGFFGEPGMRTIYRRTLLIAPWVNPYLPVVDANGLVSAGGGVSFRPEPGLVRVLPNGVTPEQAIAALVAFQDRYDLSVRLEFDPRVGADGRYKIVANTLGDLTKRENRFGHHFFRPVDGMGRERGREYPFAMVSAGSGYSGSTANVTFVSDPEIGGPSTKAGALAYVDDQGDDAFITTYSINPANLTNDSLWYRARPFAYVDGRSATVATARAMLNDDGAVVRVIHGPVPLWGTRRGEDVMLTDVLAFDLRVYDPGAPLFRHQTTETVLEPSDPGWSAAYQHRDNMDGNEVSQIGRDNTMFPFVGQGAYVDLGYGHAFWPNLNFDPAFSSAATPWFFQARALTDVHPDYHTQLAPGYAVYDTWSFHYENNGLNEDEFVFVDNAWHVVADQAPDKFQVWRGLVDQGTDGLNNSRVHGVDGVDERETAPPYDKPLRGVQVLMRVYERDSRQIRQVRVNQHFMPE